MFRVSILTLLLTMSMAKSLLASQDAPLKVGDYCPDVELKMLNYKRPTAKLSDFKANLIIIDFWATWCQTCRDFMSTSNTLAAKFGHKVEMIPVTYEDGSVAASTLNGINRDNGSAIYSIVSDSFFEKEFPHSVIPHEVWLDSNFRVIAITDENEVTEQNISALLAGKPVNLHPKMEDGDLNVDLKKPVLTGNQGVDIPDSAILFKSMMTRYVPRLHPSSSNHPNSLIILNESILGLYRLIAGGYQPEFFNRNRTILEVKDTNRVSDPLGISGQQFTEWAKKNTYCYELILKDTTLRQLKFPIALGQLNEFCKSLNIVGSFEERKRDCYVLVRKTGFRDFETSGGSQMSHLDAYSLHYVNVPFKNFFLFLQIYYLQTSPYPLLDESGITYNVDMSLDCNMSNVDSINKALEKYNLEFRKEQRSLKYLVLRDLQ